MRGFSGTEPLVGEIVALRTFRVEDSGLLLPLFADGAWYNGENIATCSPPAGTVLRLPHEVGDPDCECGFYAYGTRADAGRHWQSRYVLAVVSCWGRVVAGTRGVRATRARIEAIWLAPSAPNDLRRRVVLAYPGAVVYRDREAMLAAHPLTPLPSYRSTPRRHRWRTGVAQVLFAAVVLTLGVLPDAARTGVLWQLWLAVTLAVCGALVIVAASRTGANVSAVAVLLVALLWLVAPLPGWASPLSWALRAPVLLIAAGSVPPLLARLRPGYFPAVSTGGKRLRPTIA